MSADDPRLTGLSSVAPETDVLIGFYEDGLGVHNYNAACYYDGESLVHTHRKLYLPTYDVFEERKHFSPGQTMRAFDTRQGRMRDADLQRRLAAAPRLPRRAGRRARAARADELRAEPLPRAATTRGTYWRDITVFYARMFQCYVVFCNRVGDEGEHLRFWGGSHIVDPWGKIVCAAARERGGGRHDRDRPRDACASAGARCRSSARRASACSRARPTGSRTRAATPEPRRHGSGAPRRGGAGRDGAGARGAGARRSTGAGASASDAPAARADARAAGRRRAAAGAGSGAAAAGAGAAARRVRARARAARPRAGPRARADRRLRLRAAA